MLIDFTVENFRSIKDPVTLSMVAAPAKKTNAKPSARRNVKPDDEIAPPFRDEARNFSLLPVAAIFGANASGKSNVVQALSQFIFFIQNATTERDISRVVSPFALDSSMKVSPARFQIRVIHEGTLFTYALVLTRASILKEVLEYVPADAVKMKSRLLFERTWHEDEQTYVYKNGKDFGNGYREIQESLHAHEPFIRLLVKRLNVVVVKPFISWLKEVSLALPIGHEKEEYNWAARYLHREEFSATLAAITKIIQRFDTGIAGIEVEAVKAEQDKEDEQFEVWVIHESGGERVRWRMERESTGTQRLFGMAFNLLLMIEGGGLSMIDELGSNIHPNITRAIVRMYQSEKTNPNRAQLIFTSHDNTLQRGNLLRRDQIWFTQKRADGSTELYPLSDFKPRNDLAIDKAYLEGRFGAVPILPDEEELLEPAEAK
jgi:AAA15 family ATPase/GTPase